MPIDLQAWTSEVRELSPDQAAALDAMDLVQVGREDPPGSYRLATGSRVGVVQLPDGETLRVAPKISIPQLMFLLSYAADPRGWRDVGPQFEEADLFAAVASAFVAHAERAVHPAPLRGYVAVDEAVLAIRGRIRVGDQIARHAGLPLPVEVTYDDFAIDIPENQLLLGAAELLIRLPLVPVPVRRRLLRLRATFAGVAPTLPGPEVRAPARSRVNAHYTGAMALAALILRRTGITTTGDGVEGISFSFDLNVVFEQFLTVSLCAALERRGGRVVAQHRMHLDDDDNIAMKPDLTWWNGDVCRAVLDAKYKALQDERFPNADAYQLLAYCTALDLPEGYLVYARDGGATARTHVVRHAGTRINVEAVDLEQAPEDVLSDVRRLSDKVEARARTSAMQSDSVGLAP